MVHRSPEVQEVQIISILPRLLLLLAVLLISNVFRELGLLPHLLGVALLRQFAWISETGHEHLLIGFLARA